MGNTHNKKLYYSNKYNLHRTTILCHRVQKDMEKSMCILLKSPVIWIKAVSKIHIKSSLWGMLPWLFLVIFCVCQHQNQVIESVLEDRWLVPVFFGNSEEFLFYCNKLLHSYTQHIETKLLFKVKVFWLFY